MLSDSAHRMRRSKSTPSVRRRHPAVSPPQSLDPETARHHATKAASLAMTQAKDKINASHEGRKSRSEDAAPIPAATTIRRSSSIRFTREAGLPKYQNTTSHNAARVPHEKKASNEQQVPVDKCTVNEFQGFGNEELFAPSSYRRLRKAKSMFSTKSMRNSQGSGTVSSTKPSCAENLSHQKSTENAADTHKPLRHSLSFFNGTSQTIRRAKSQHIMRGRDRSHVSRVEEISIPQNHTPLPAREGRLAQKSLRPLARPMRELSPGDDMVSVPHGSHKKSRTFTLNIKKRLKRVFGRGASVEDRLSDEPAFGSPYRGTVFDSPTTIGGTSPPTLHSKQSFESIATSTSRVTSWTNSTAGNTFKAQSNTGRNLLSTIDEGGDSFIGQHFESTERHGSKHDQQIDSQRVYSALMRHIGETASKDGERVVSSGTVRGYPVITERSSSVQSGHEDRSIRQVASDLSMKTARTSFPVDSRSQSPQNHSSYYRYLEASKPVIPSKTSKNGTLVSKKSSSSLQESQSPFFPSKASAKPKTPSPYKVAMSSIREADDYDTDTASVVIKQSANTRRISTSPSVYSRTPSGCTGSQENLQHGVEDTMQSGMATIFDSQVPYRSPKKNVSPAANIRSKNSAEWKNWMDSQIRNITVFETPKLSSPLDARKHHRENAECDEEPLQIGFGTGNQSPKYAERLKSTRSLSGLRNLNEPREFRLPTPITERKLSSQSNFSRPLSRQSVGSFKMADRIDGGVLPRLYEDPRSVKLSTRQDTSEPTKPTRSTDILNSPNRRLAIKTAREARLNRSPGGLSTVRQVDDLKDVKDIQFRSIRGDPYSSTRNNENETSPSMQLKENAASGRLNLSELHTTIDSKRMVDIFLDSRRARVDTPDREPESPAFI